MATKDGMKTGGRVKGTLNKANQDVQKKLRKLNCDPIEGMVKIANMSMESNDYELAARMYKELAQYVAPKLRSMEVKGDAESRLIIHFDKEDTHA